MAKKLTAGILIILLLLAGCAQSPAETPTPTPEPEPTPAPPTETPETTPEAEILKVVGQVGGPTQAVAVQGNYAYVGVGLRLIVLDISAPTVLREVGAALPFEGFVEDVAVLGSIAYIAAGGAGLYLVDISNPAKPTVVGVCDTPGYAEGVTVSGQYAYVADGAAGLRIVDIADPSHPTEVGVAYSLNYAFDVAVRDRHVYLAAGSAGLLVADIADATNPVELSSLDTPGYACGIAVSGNTVFIADTWEGLRVLDITDPNQPEEVAFYESPGWAIEVAVAGSTVYIADASAGLQVVDISERTKPTGLGSYEVPGGHAGSLAVSEKLAYVADHNLGLHVVDISTPAQPRCVGCYSPIGFADGVAVAGNYAYVAAGRYGLRVVNVRDAAQPREVSDLPTDYRATTVAIAGNCAFVSTFGAFMYLVDISDPTHPHGCIYDISQPGRTGNNVRNQVIHEGILYLASEGQLTLHDIHTPLSPHELSCVDLWGSAIFPAARTPTATGIAVSGKVAYLAAEAGGVWMIDVSDPRRPTRIGVFDEPATMEPKEKGKTKPIYAGDLAVLGDFLYVIDDDLLRVLDVSDPTSPREVGSLSLPAGIFGWGPFLAIAGHTVYIADGAAGLVAVDVLDPTNPRLTARQRLPGYASAVVVDGSYAYVACQDGGLFIIQCLEGAEGPNETSSTQSGMPMLRGKVCSVATPVVSPWLFGSTVPVLLTDQGQNWPLNEAVSFASISRSRHQAAKERPSSGTTLTVTSAADSGPGTLRQTLLDAQSGDSITFDPAIFPRDAPATIYLRTSLPGISQGNLTIDASNAGVVLDGSSTPQDSCGIRIMSDYNTVKGLQIFNFPGDGIIVGPGRYNTIGGERSRGEGNVISGSKSSDIHLKIASNNVIMGNYIGTDAAGQVKVSSGDWMVLLDGGSASNVIEGNVIAGGLCIIDVGSSYNEVIGNFIGVDATGTRPFDGWAGVHIAGQPFNRIGGTTAEERNVINGSVGVHGARDNFVIGNFVGTDATGTQAIGSAWIPLEGDHNFVEQNVIAGQMALGAGADCNFIGGNYIGTDVTGSVALSGALSVSGGEHNVIQANLIVGGKQPAALSLDSGANYNWVRHNRVGTDVSGTMALSDSKTIGVAVEHGEGNVIEGNLISGNGGGGVILGEKASRNWLRGNYIGTAADGVSALPNNGKGGVVVYGTSNVIGGPSPEDGNVIGYNFKAGILVCKAAQHNCIVHNSLIENVSNAADEGENNVWDSKGEGNYWSDYKGKDENGDGIGDTPYPVPPKGVDNHPLMKPAKSSLK